MRRLLRTVSWRHAKRHRLRTALTFFGIALGVGVIVAIAVVNRSLTTSFQSTIDQIAGKAVLQVANGESGIAESLFPDSRHGGRPRCGAGSGSFCGCRPTGERLYVYGVDCDRLPSAIINSATPNLPSTRPSTLLLNSTPSR